MRQFIQSLLRSQGYYLRSTRHFGDDHWKDVRHLLEKRGAAASPVVFDVGAHHGEAYQSIRGAFPGATMHCFEPDPESFEILSAKVGKTRGVTLWPVALGAEKGTARFHRNSDSMTNSLLPTAAEALASDYGSMVITGSTIEVPVRTLDDICTEAGITHLDILKTDCQGYDLKVLEGGKRFLSEHRATIVSCEVIFDAEYVGQGGYHELCGFLDSLGYRLVGFYHMARNKRCELTFCDAVFVAPANQD